MGWEWDPASFTFSVGIDKSAGNVGVFKFALDEMHAFPISPNSHLLLFRAFNPYFSHRNPSLLFTNSTPPIYSPKLLFIFKSTPEPSHSDSDSAFFDHGDHDDESHSLGSSLDLEPQSVSHDGVDIEIEKLGKNSRRIRSRIAIQASLDTIWNLLTDYERLADFIPSLAVSQLLEKRENFARIFQIGQQNLAFGLKFNAKGIVDCYEKDLKTLPFGQRRDIEFKMIEGDFQTFEGKWSIEQTNSDGREGINSSLDQEYQTTLSYVVDVEPKLWLPVGLVEGRLCREFKMNLSCIRKEAQKAVHNILPSC